MDVSRTTHNMLVPFLTLFQRTLRFRTAGQRLGLLAVLGPRPSEQVVLVLATGSGKTLVAIAAAALNRATEARPATLTTILVLLIVALCGDMLRRLEEVGIRPHVWGPG